MKANKRVRDLRRRSRTGVRKRMAREPFYPVTTQLFTRDKQGKRIHNREVEVA